MNANTLFDGAAGLAHWGVIRARGADAASFLHGQLTSDIASLGQMRARLTGYCSAKGRLLASFIVWKSAENEFLLACSADLLEQTLKRLRMFVLRAKCALSDARGEVQLVGLVGAPATGWLADAAPDATWERRERDGLSAIRLPDAAGCVRYLCALDTGASIPWPPPAADAWRWLEVRSGVARIEQSTVERFVPQMLNYELLGGVDFHKGCYPGQEVVARSQYRGAVKRRSFLFEAPCAALAGDEVFHSDDAAQPAGTVVNAAAQPTGYPAGSVALVEVKLAVLAGGSLHLGAAQGPQLRQIALPYEVALGTLGAD